MTETKNLKYIHFEEAHNLNDPSIIVPVIMDVLNPKSVIDVGCGIGTFLHVFKKHGVKDILGLDGKWANKEKLKKYISPENFIETDLENGFQVDRKYDLVFCLEVAEHLHENSADILIKSLTSVSDIIIFSAAIPGQMGQNHINEQWPDYWIDKFQKHDFICHDVFRPIFWNNQNIARWYKQNMFLYTKKGKDKIATKFEKYFDNNISNYVHPEYYELRVNDIVHLSKAFKNLDNNYRNIIHGKATLKKYLGYLAKYMLFRLGMYHK